MSLNSTFHKLSKTPSSRQKKAVTWVCQELLLGVRSACSSLAMHSMRPWPKLVHSVYLLNRRGLSCVCARIVTSRGFWPIVSSVTRLLGCLTIVCSAWEGLAIELGRYYIMNTLIYYNNIKRIAKTVTQYLSHLLS